jgi:arylsulfatase A-like enzyme
VTLIHRAAFALPASVALATAIGGATSPAEAQEARRPNIVLIVADDLGYSDLGAFGGEIDTPNLDQLVADGVQLTNFYASPTCSPSRAMLLSGTDNHIAGLGNMIELMTDEQTGRPGYEGVLNDRVVPFPKLLQDSGYSTYMAGKWHLGGKPEQLPVSRGFDEATYLVGGSAGHFDNTGASAVAPKAAYREGFEEFTLPASFYSTDLYTDTVIRYVSDEEREDQPFFAYLAYTSPHWPLQAPPEFIEKYAGRYDVGYEAIRSARLERMMSKGLVGPQTSTAEMIAAWPKWDELSPAEQERESRMMQVYAAMVDNLDANIGRLVEKLKADGEYDNTVFFFMSDNGAEGNDPDQTHPANAKWLAETFDNSTKNIGTVTSFVGYGPVWGSIGSTPFKAFKGYTYEGGIRVPAFVTAPGRLEPGRSDDLTSIMDIAPTILELAQVESPGTRYEGRDVEPIQGKSLWPSLGGDGSAARSADEAISWELMGRIGVRQGDWKLIWSNEPVGKADWELFDLASDPAESRDLSSRNPEKLAEMIGIWEEYREKGGVVWSPEIGDKIFYSNNDNHFGSIQ